MFKVPEKYRIKHGQTGSTEMVGNNGQFFFKQHVSAKIKGDILVQASDGDGFEHVSLSKRRGTPSWEEVCFIKDLFWSDDDLVVQFHPPKKEYINVHKNCLHLWRKCGTNDFVERPDLMLV